MQGGAKAEAYMPHVEGHALSVAFITVGEMYYGAEKANWGERKRAKLEAHLHNFTVISFDRLIARHYGKIRAERRKRGRIIAPNDAWIAACAVRGENGWDVSESRDGLQCEVEMETGTSKTYV